MTFKYAVTFPLSGSHKLNRFHDWAAAHLPALDYSAPPQAPIKSETLTIRLRSIEDRARLLKTMASVPLRVDQHQPEEQ